MDGFEELNKNQLKKALWEENTQNAVEQSEKYRQTHANAFASGYNEVVGGSSYVKIKHLKKKGPVSKSFSWFGKKSDSDETYEANKEACKKGLYDGDEEGIFANESDAKQMEFVKSLAERCKILCDMPIATPEFIKAVSALDAYITAGTYEDQQQTLVKALEGLENFIKNNSQDEDNPVGLALSAQARRLCDMLNSRTDGELEIPEEVRADALKVAKNPDAGFLGTYSDAAKLKLFPHEPSPNDVKQRTTCDCYMMSALSALALQEPDYIKKSMKDNGNTVTVRFFDPENKPIYITVKKEITTYLGMAQKNAVDSLWVQMIEKAFAVLYGNIGVQDRNRTGARDTGDRSYAALDYQDSFAFLKRFKGPEYENTGGSVSLLPSEDYKEFEDEQHRGIATHQAPNSDIYSGTAERLYDNFATRIGQKEIITVGISRAVKNVPSGFHVSHAYAVMKMFSKEVGGRTRHYIRLRDPYGAFTVDYNEQGQSKNTGLVTPLESTSTMGTFDLEWNAFLNTFDSYCGCNIRKIPDLEPQASKAAKAAAIEKDKLEHPEKYTLDGDDFEMLDEFEVPKSKKKK